MNVSRIATGLLSISLFACTQQVSTEAAATEAPEGPSEVSFALTSPGGHTLLRVAEGVVMASVQRSGLPITHGNYEFVVVEGGTRYYCGSSQGQWRCDDRAIAASLAGEDELTRVPEVAARTEGSLSAVRPRILPFIIGAIVGGIIYDGVKALAYCENHWQDFGTGSYDSLMAKCMTVRMDPRN